jgi:hypothetical protein
MTPQELPAVLAALEIQVGEKRFLVVSRSEPLPAMKHFFPDACSVEWLGDIENADDIDANIRADLCVVFNQLEHMDQLAGAHLLSRLRDSHSRKVLLHYAGQTYSGQELLALGFIQQKRASLDRHFFLFDPDEFFQQRDWNTSDKWAHPDNFRKYRW